MHRTRPAYERDTSSPPHGDDDDGVRDGVRRGSIRIPMQSADCVASARDAAGMTDGANASG
ncbi:hypothetical protein WG70_04465 [Burkholderia oklahomensis EO147]|nr:hypothetical protein WG70_04465 [Burkholderia oklahomensis EO147]KUY65646.1 hypothetical protein WG70_27910 [Burkholderia oklahomensis EO147]